MVVLSTDEEMGGGERLGFEERVGNSASDTVSWSVCWSVG